MNTNLIHKLRALFFSPDSKSELWARSLYHRIAGTKLHFKIQNWLARHTYQRWIRKQQNEHLPEIDRTKKQPLVTFILDCQKNQGGDLANTLNTIQNLEGDHWQVLLVTNPDDSLQQMPSSIANESKFIIINQLDANLLEAIQGEFVILCQAGDRFHPSLLQRFSLQLAHSPDVDLVYYDCEVQSPQYPSPAPVFKPMTPSPTLCLSFNLFSRGFIRTALLRENLDRSTTDQDLFIDEYDLCLKLLEKGVMIQHIPSVLVSQTTLPTPVAPEAQQIVLDHLARSGVQKPVASQTPQGTRFIWRRGNPSLSIIIPSKNNASLLNPLIQALQKNVATLAININIVDNDSDDPKTLAYYRTLESESNIQILPYRKPFNYSEAINLGVYESESDLVLLMNDDMEPIEPDWLPEMIQWAQREDIGVVGAKLLRANHTLQHAGIIMGLVGFVGHIYQNAPEDYFGLWGSANWYRDILAVTGACQMMRRDVFELVGGYDEAFKLAFGDIDFCLRVHEQGYRNIYTPFARLYHYEGRSRGYVTPVEDILRGYEAFESYLMNDDPFFSPNLTYTRIPKCQLNPLSTGARGAQIRARKQFYTSAS